MYIIIGVAILITLGCTRQQPGTDASLDSTDSLSGNFDAEVYSGKLKGSWYRNALGARSTLTLTPISPERIEFQFEAQSGANMGELDGFFTVHDNRSEYIVEEPGFDRCRVTFDGSVEGSIRVEQEGCQGYTGAGVVFLGMYDRTMISDERLALAQLEERFGPDATKSIQDLMGYDFDEIVSTLHVNELTENGPEPSETTVFYTRGIRPSSMSCLSVNQQTGEVWVAYIKENKLIVLGPVDRAPDAFTNWIAKITEELDLEVMSGDQ